MCKKILLISLLILGFFSNILEGQTLSPVLYPRTPNGSKIEAMYIDSVNNVLYIGGNFTSLELPPTYTSSLIRTKIAAINLSTGQLLPWAPVITGGNVYCINKLNDTIYAGGNFTSVDGQTKHSLVAFKNGAVLPVYFDFGAGDIVKSIAVNGTSIFTGGYINSYGGASVGNLVQLNSSGTLVRAFDNYLLSYYFMNVSKIELNNNKLYFIAETTPDFFSIYDQSLSYFDLSVPNGLANYLIQASGAGPWGGSTIPKIDDFTINGDDFYITGNFNQLAYGPSVSSTINRDLTACYNRVSQTFNSWNPTVYVNTNANTLSSNHGILSDRILPFEDRLFLSQEYSDVIDTSAYISGSTQFFNPITGAPALYSVTTTTGSFVKEMKISNGNLILSSYEIASTAPLNRFSSIYSYCLKTRAATVPKEVTNKNIFCRMQSYSFYVPNRPEYYSSDWSYTGTGATISGNGNDTITISFSLNATSGDLIIAGQSPCGDYGPSNFKTINFYALPNVSAGADTTLNCRNNLHLMLGGFSTVPNHSFIWNGPGQLGFQGDSAYVDTPGNYNVTVTDSSNTCQNIDYVQVTVDTIAPVITSPSSYSITSCNPNYIIINGTSDNASDSIKWLYNNGGFLSYNPATISNQNNYIVSAQRNTNGCITTDTVIVTNNTVAPVINPHTWSNPAGTPFPILDTLTCTNDSIIMSFSSSATNALIRIIDPLNDTISNNSYATIPGTYKVIIIDTVSQCTGATIFFTVHIYKTNPVVSLPTNSPTLGCSSANTILDGSSPTSNALLAWTGPNSFSSADPATITQPGTYILTVTNPDNGCTKSDSINITQQNILTLNSSADTTVCNGTQVTLSTSPVGGTPNFTYVWSNGAGTNQTVAVSPTDTTQYIVTVSDGAGCIGKDTIVINIPSSISESTVTFQPCDLTNPNGQIQINASGGVPPYQYSINNGSSFQASSVFPNLSFGTYPVIITDALNCTHSYSTTISSSSQSPKPDFIISSTMMQADTFVVVDISNPRPDTIIWTFPPTVSVINNNQYAPVIVSSDTGSVSVTMEAHFGGCITFLSKTVRFIKPDTLPASPNGNGIEEVTLFPNPNSGQFSVEVKLFKKQTFAVYIYNSQGIEQARAVIPKSDYGLNSFSLIGATPGTYVLKVIAEYDSKSKIFTITQ